MKVTVNGYEVDVQKGDSIEVDQDGCDEVEYLTEIDVSRRGVVVAGYCWFGHKERRKEETEESFPLDGQLGKM